MSGVPIDDVTIGNSASLWRRILREQIVPDENVGTFRPSSAAFSNSSDGSGMSVTLGDQVLAEGRSPESTLAESPDSLLAAITAGVARENLQIVFREPLDEEPAHAEVFGDKSKSVQRKFAKASIWIVPPARIT